MLDVIATAGYGWAGGRAFFIPSTQVLRQNQRATLKAEHDQAKVFSYDDIHDGGDAKRCSCMIHANDETKLNESLEAVHGQAVKYLLAEQDGSEKEELCRDSKRLSQSETLGERKANKGRREGGMELRVWKGQSEKVEQCCWSTSKLVPAGNPG
jgi:hypothetical protein